MGVVQLTNGELMLSIVGPTGPSGGPIGPTGTTGNTGPTGPRSYVTVTNADFQGAIDALPATGGEIMVPPDVYSSLVPSLLVVGSKAVTWLAHGATLPAQMPGLVVRSGIFSLPETSIQSNRNVRVHYKMDFDDTEAVGGTISSNIRSYGIHITGFLRDDGTTTGEAELRAYSFDLGTDTTNSQEDIRGMKGRVYGQGGRANIRALYGFAESVVSSGHSGELTGVLGTVYRNGNPHTDGDAYAVRGHADGTAQGCFQAAGKDATDNIYSFGFSCRTGTGNPAMPAEACFQAHGGGTGRMYMGYRSNSDLTVTYEVDRNARVQAFGGFCSGTVLVPDGTVYAISPPQLSGMMTLFAQTADQLWAQMYFRASGTALLRAAGVNGTLVTLNTGVVPNGSTGTAGSLNLYCVNDGHIYVENRTGSDRQIIWHFITR